MPWNRKTTARDRKRKTRAARRKRGKLSRLTHLPRGYFKTTASTMNPVYATKAEFWNPDFEDLVFEDFDEAKHASSRVIEVVFRAPEGHHIAYTRLGPDEPMVPIVVKNRSYGVIYGYNE